MGFVINILWARQYGKKINILWAKQYGKTS